MKIQWDRCPIHHSLYRSSVGCDVCMKEKQAGKEPGTFGVQRPERLEDVDGRRIEG